MAVDGIKAPGDALFRQQASKMDLLEQTGGASNPGEAFEGMMLRKMVQALRATVQESGLFEGVTGGQVYDHFIEQALSDHLAQAGGIGIAQLFEESKGSPVNTAKVPGAIDRKMEPSESTDTPAKGLLSADDGSRPLAELLPPQYDSWLNSPAAEQTLRASLEGGKLRSP